MNKEINVIETIAKNWMKNLVNEATNKFHTNLTYSSLNLLLGEFVLTFSKEEDADKIELNLFDQSGFWLMEANINIDKITNFNLEDCIIKGLQKKNDDGVRTLYSIKNLMGNNP